jgi:hypothetical protein
VDVARFRALGRFPGNARGVVLPWGALTPTVKFEVFPLLDLREIDDRIWFKLKLDDKAKWKPARWQTPPSRRAGQSCGRFCGRSR